MISYDLFIKVIIILYNHTNFIIHLQNESTVVK